MIVRIRLGHGPTVRRKRRKNQHVALAVASLLTPAAVMACVLACWRIAADFKATGQFPIDSGLFSHWQVWLACGAFIQLCAMVLNRYGKSDLETGSVAAGHTPCPARPHSELASSHDAR